MKQAHFVMTTKGGVGKSYVASLITQWLMSRDKEVQAFDNDPATATLFAYKALPVKRIQLVTNEDEIDQAAYDQMVTDMLAGTSDFVIDNGASNYFALINYMRENGLFDVLRANEIRPVVHTPVMGGGSLEQAVLGVHEVLQSLDKETEMVVWLNEHEGPIAGDGKTWQEFAVYQRWKSRITAEVVIKEQRGELFQKLMRGKILGPARTFAEFAQLGDDEAGVMEKQRAHLIAKEIFSQLDQVLGAGACNKAA
jgi:hypothetical protein